MAESGVTGLPTLRVQNHVATVELTRPAQRNALRKADLLQLLAHFEAINTNSDVRVALLQAQTAPSPRPVFCAGYDLEGFNDPAHDPGLFARVADALHNLRPITVCAVNGSVFGGATDLVLACDLRIGLAGTQWRMPALALGYHYYGSGLQRYVCTLGQALTKRAFFSGEALAIEALHAAGAFQAVVPATEFEVHVAQLVQRVQALAPEAAQATKRSIRELASGQFDAARLAQREACSLASDEFVQRREAMAKRQEPKAESRKPKAESRKPKADSR